MGDGAGMLVQIPHRFFTDEAARLGFALPRARHLCRRLPVPAAGSRKSAPAWRSSSRKSSPRRARSCSAGATCRSTIRRSPRRRKSPRPSRSIARSSSAAARCIESEDEFERRLFIIRKVISNRIYAAYSGLDNDFYVVSLSARTIVYKGMFLAYQLGAYYRDLHDERFESALALVHQRFSTNTFPSWRLAHPYRMVAHNGEINTVRGNVNWMAARQASVDSRALRQRHLQALADLL